MSTFGPRALLQVLPPGPACLLDGLQLAGRRVALVAWRPRWRLAGALGFDALRLLPAAAGLAESIPAGFDPDVAALLTGCCAVIGHDALAGEAAGGSDLAADACGRSSDGTELPAGVWAFAPGAAVLFDPERGVLYLAAVDPAAQAEIDALLARAEHAPSTAGAGHAPPLADTPVRLPAHGVQQSLDAAGYMAMVRAAQAEMATGRLQKVILSLRYLVPAEVEPLIALERLAESEPLLLYLYREERFTLLGAAPEWLVGRRGEQAWLHPLAGTRALAGSTLAARGAELQASPKEIGEHLRALALCQEDLAPFCQPGSLRVTRRLAVEQHGPLCHLASRVEGRLKPDTCSASLVAACLPAGTVAGVPRAAAMQFIAAHEPAPRGLYGGGVGHWQAGDDLQLFLPIRSLLYADGIAHVQAGAGCMPDSDPGQEYAECCQKAAAGLRALGVIDWGVGGRSDGAGSSGGG